MRKVIRFGQLCILSLLVFASGCSRNPVTGKKEIMLISKGQEDAMGASYNPTILATYGVYDDAKMQEFINVKGKEMGKISHRPELDYKFKILDSPVVNAFAVPGGYVYFTRGIMAHFNNEAEFAGVLGHEIGHVTARHTAKQQTKQTLAQVGLVGAMIASPKFAQYGQQASQALGLLFLKFGRDHESQSDMLGVEYSTKIGYDSHEMADFFQTLRRLSEQSGQSLPTFLSTHPDPVDRYNKVHEMSDEAQKNLDKTKLQVNRNQYLRMIEGLVYGEDPRQGYFDMDYFFQPTLKFQFPIPRGWQKMNAPTQVQMAPEGGKAMMMFSFAEGATVEEAANKFIQENKLTVVNSTKRQVNGMPAVQFVADQIPEQQQGAQQSQQTAPTIRILTYMIQYNGTIYRFHGLSEQKDFNQYFKTFEYTMQNFKPLTDPARINVTPERIRIKTIPSSTTLGQTLITLKQDSKRHAELGILNGMKLTDPVKAGDLIKVIGK